MEHVRAFRRRDVVLWLVLVVLSVPAAQMLHRRARQIMALEKQKSSLRAALAGEIERQKELVREREALLTDPVFIEKQARESLGLRRDGEVLLPPGPADGRAAGVQRHFASAGSRLDRLMAWRFFPAVFVLCVGVLCGAGLVLGSRDPEEDEGAGLDCEEFSEGEHDTDDEWAADDDIDLESLDEDDG